MAIELNLNQLDHQPAVSRGETDGRARNPSLYGEITGQIAAGRYILQIGEPCGAVLREASRAERAHIRPRPTPIFLQPRSIRGLIDRRMELAAALSAFDAGLPVEASGEPGIGKTAVLRHLAHDPRVASFVDGIIYLPARHQSPADLQQLIFEAFYETDQIGKPTEAEIRRGLQDKQALILLDDVDLTQHELEQVMDLAPRSAFAVATRERCLWGEVRSLALKGLPAEDAVLLLERELERSLDVTERSAATSLCAALGGHPLRILQAAAIARDQGISIDECARTVAPANLITELITSIDRKQRRALLALAALPGVPLRIQHVSGIAEVPDIEPSLMMLVRRCLVASNQSRHQLTAGVGDQLRRTEDLKPWVNRAITYFTAWAERYRRNPVSLLEESEALLRAQQCATDTARWGEVLRLGRLLEGALVLGARWGAWAVTLERCLAAAKAIGDRSAEAWALHEIGTRAVCLGDPGMARALLSQAVKLREAMDDMAAAAVSRRNLTVVLAPEPAPDSSRERPRPLRDEVPGLDSLPLRNETQQTIRSSKTNRVSPVLLTVALLAILAGLAYWADPAGPFWTFWNVASISSFLQGGPGGSTAAPSTALPRPQAAAELRVLQFSAVPDRIAPGEPVRLCYEVANGTGVRIDPDIGEVGDLPRSCVPAAPMETTTYLLTAQGAAGESARQSVRVLVSPAASRIQADEPDAVRPGSKPEGHGEPPFDSAAPWAPVSDRASILIFTSRPSSIASDGPTRLCYAVSGALKVRVEPGIGEVNPTSMLTCLRVAPVRTTTYELTAYGRDRHEVKQQLVIIVR
jgi:hypothetical protein